MGNPKNHGTSEQVMGNPKKIMEHPKNHETAKNHGNSKKSWEIPEICRDIVTKAGYISV